MLPRPAAVLPLTLATPTAPGLRGGRPLPPSPPPIRSGLRGFYLPLQPALESSRRPWREHDAPWEARTPDLEVNSLTLWPAELRKL